jgi:transposase
MSVPCARALPAQADDRGGKDAKRHLLNLINYHHYRVTNATAEGLTSRIQAINANAGGFRSFQNFRVRILFFLGKLDLGPD